MTADLVTAVAGWHLPATALPDKPAAAPDPQKQTSSTHEMPCTFREYQNMHERFVMRLATSTISMLLETM
jgi:hypothetical protein